MSIFSPLHLATNDSNAWVQAANEAIAKAAAQGAIADDEDLLALAVQVAQANITQKEGGPFGAVLVDRSGALPKVVGMGANHVTPQHDPSAHAEVEACRDAAIRLGRSDLTGLELFTSCECCPMCLAVANGAGVSRIAYVATRDAAAQAGFSDELQYRLCQLDDAAIATHIADDKRDELSNKLAAHGAMVLNANGEVLAFGDADTQHDPSAVASVQALRGALKAVGDVWLPAGCTLVSYQQPHLAGLMLADWARLLRPRDAANPQLPERDGLTPNPLHICYLNDSSEEIIVRDADGQDQIAQDAAITRVQPTLPDSERAVPTARGGGMATRHAAQMVFDEWQRGVASGSQARY